MEQAIAIETDFDDRNETHDLAAGEVIDAFDHVLEALDQVIALTKFAFPEGTEFTRH